MAFQSAIQAVQQKPLYEQVEHWITVIERGEFGEGSMRSFLKTDYEAYEQLVKLGTPAIPHIQQHLNNSLKPDTPYILEMVLKDLNA